MAEHNYLILERSSQNLQKITKNGKTMLEGVFAEFGVENRNGRIYEEKEYLPHLEYLKKDIANGNLLGELDHPERFEVALGSVSHRISELWYDQAARQVKGRIEIIDGTPKGQIAKSLLEAGVPLSISSRAAGTVNEDKTVAIQQIYTYDLVAKPGFESAQLHQVNEGANPRQAEINKMIAQLNESSNSRQAHSVNENFGMSKDGNISIIDLTDKFPHLKLRDEAIALNKTKINENKQMADQNPQAHMDEDTFQKWTVFFKKELSAINERLDAIQNGGSSTDLTAIKKYIEKIRKIQEDSLNWQSEVAKSVNEVAVYADKLAQKSNKHYKFSQKIAETVGHNAKVLNATQDWTSEVAKTTNAIAESVDHNAAMLNGLNEWTTQIAKGVNNLNEWGTEKAKAINDIHDWVGTQAKAINGMHEWTSSIAKNLNGTVNWSEEMFGRAISKEDATKLMEYVELVAESKSNPQLRSKIDEMLKTHSITARPLNESNLKGIAVIDSVKRTGNSKVDTSNKGKTAVAFDGKTIVAKLRKIKLSKERMPVGNDKLQMNPNKSGSSLGSGNGLNNDPAKLKADNLKHTRTIAQSTANDGKGPTHSYASVQRMKLNQKPDGRTNENFNTPLDIQTRRSNLEAKLEKIANSLEKERSISENVQRAFPFVQLLSESDQKRFAGLDATDKQKVANEIKKVPTSDSKVIVKLWENALTENNTDQPLWLTLAPKAYKDAFAKAPQMVKENVTAKAEFYNLTTQYQIDNFWETSNVIAKPTYSLNESISAVTPEESEQKLDTFVAGIGEAMKRFF